MPLLNPAQKNRLTIVLRSLEDDLQTVRRLITSENKDRILSRDNNPLPRASQHKVAQIIAETEKVIAHLAQKFQLEKLDVDVVAVANAILSVQWVTLCEANAKGLKGYGKVAENLASELDPHVKKLIALVTQIKDILLSRSTPDHEDNT